MRLIDADALVYNIEKIMELWQVSPSNMNISAETLILYLKSMPVIDPVKHGHWKMYGTAYKCSVCNEGDAFGLTPYCRWCGSKMCEEVGKDAN